MGNSDLLLVYRNMNAVIQQMQRVDIVITPQFYTLKREMIPVKYVYQAKRIAPSLFEGLIENGEDRGYFVYREGEEWVFIAYSSSEIRTFLQEKGIVQTGKVFFAQQLAPRLSGVIPLGEREALMNLDGTVTIVPAAGLHEVSLTTLTKEMLPAKGIRFSSGGSVFLENIQAYLLAALLLLFGVLWFVEGVRYGKTVNSLQAEREVYYSQYPVLQNSYTRENILQKYRKIDHTERKKRDIVSKISRVLSKKVTLEDFSMDKQKYTATLKTSDDTAQKNATQMLKKSGFRTVRASGREIVIEGTL